MDMESFDGCSTAPWKAVYADGYELHHVTGERLPDTVARGYGDDCRPNAAFIAHARTSLPALARAVIELSVRVEAWEKLAPTLDALDDAISDEWHDPGGNDECAKCGSVCASEAESKFLDEWRTIRSLLAAETAKGGQ